MTPGTIHDGLCRCRRCKPPLHPAATRLQSGHYVLLAIVAIMGACSAWLVWHGEQQRAGYAVAADRAGQQYPVNP